MIDLDEVPYEYRGCVLLIQAIEKQAIADYLKGSYDAFVYLNSMDKYKGKLKPLQDKTSIKDLLRCPKEIKEHYIKRRLMEYYKYGIDYCIKHWKMTYNGVYLFVRKYATIYTKQDLLSESAK